VAAHGREVVVGLDDLAFADLDAAERRVLADLLGRIIERVSPGAGA